MNLLQEIDFDKAVLPILKDFAEEISEWLKGSPTNESALTNRLTEVLGKSRRRCDIGVNPDTSLNIEHYLLDRRGPQNTDLFGSDIAVTVRVKTPDRDMIKTALIQLKVSENFSVELEGRQLTDAIINSVTQNISFILAVDREQRGAMRVSFAQTLHKAFPSGQKTHRFDSSNWSPFALWLHEWLSCHIGAPSDPKDSRSIEKILERLLPQIRLSQITPEEILREMDLKTIPTRHWVRFTLTVPRRDYGRRD